MEEHIEIPEYCKCSCKGCGNNIEFPREGLGQVITCPHCSRETTLFDGSQVLQSSQPKPPVLNTPDTRDDSKKDTPSISKVADQIAISATQPEIDAAASQNIIIDPRYPREPRRDDQKYKRWPTAEGQKYAFELDHLRWKQGILKMQSETVSANQPPAEQLQEQKADETSTLQNSNPNEFFTPASEVQGYTNALKDVVFSVFSRVNIKPKPDLQVRQGYRQEKAELRWVRPNEMVEIGDFKITSGMFYMGNGRIADVEASAINTRLPVGRPVVGDAARLGYYSQYQWISPDHRATYLSWLAAGRQDTKPGERDLGYLFLYFYGLERRLLIDNAQEQEPVAEIVRLLDEYGPHIKSRSLQNYFCQLIHFWGWSQGADYYLKLLEWMRTLPVSLLGEDELAIVLASHYQSQTRVGADLAYTLTRRHEDSRRSVIVSRVNEEFRKLFTKRYFEQYPDGLLLESAKRSSQLEYRPASPTLLQFRYGEKNSLCISVPDVLGLSSQFQLLPKLWNSCIEDLSDYSRAKGKTTDTSGSLNTYLALPEELRAATKHPLTTQWEVVLSQARAVGAGFILDLGEVAQLLDLAPRTKLTITQSRQVAEVVESLGFAVEPDARQDSTYLWDQPIAVFKPVESKVSLPSTVFSGAATLLKLCILVAGADGQVADDEMVVVRRLIDQNVKLSEADRQRLEMLEQLLIVDPSSASSSLGKLAKLIPAPQREKIGELLVHVAAADNIVTKDELRALGRIFKVFEIAEEKIHQFLEAIRPQFGEITIQTAGKRVAGEAIPPPSQPFSIDMSLVDRIAKETSEVVGILAKVMAENEPETESQTLLPKTTTRTVIKEQPVQAAKSEETSIPEWFVTLDVKYHAVLLQLIERVTWPRDEFNALVGSFQLMPLDAHDAINEWSDEHLGDFLLEGDDPILIRKELIK